MHTSAPTRRLRIERPARRLVLHQFNPHHETLLPDVARRAASRAAPPASARRSTLFRAHRRQRGRSCRTAPATPAPPRTPADCRCTCARGRTSCPPTARPRNASKIRCVANVAASGRYPPVIPLATHIRSGSTPSCSQANIRPVRPNPVATSSQIRCVPERPGAADRGSAGDRAATAGRCDPPPPHRAPQAWGTPRRTVCLEPAALFLRPKRSASK